jgi:NADH:ubiquinone oxidoreductase subunit 5 (subunit L)/multisubunit Na+/H+ antiporter MnhA subunit
MKNDKLLIIATIIMLFMGVVMYYQNKSMNKMRDLLEKVDTTTYADTIYLDKVIRDTMPQTITQTIFKCDTLWRVEGDSVVGEPQLITLVKKKSVKH